MHQYAKNCGAFVGCCCFFWVGGYLHIVGDQIGDSIFLSKVRVVVKWEMSKGFAT